MKTILIPAFLCMLLACSCAGDGPVDVAGQKVADPSMVPHPLGASVEDTAKSHVLGYYAGMFNAVTYKEKEGVTYVNKINISIDSLSNGKVKGHSVVAGNNRPFLGSYTKSPSGYKIIAKEPGDDKYDGVFTFELDTVNRTVAGTWKSFRPGLDVTERKYALDYVVFMYNAAQELSPELDFPPEPGYAETDSTGEENYKEEERVTDAVSAYNSSLVKLKKPNVENMFKGDLEIMRNSIYARHGYSFKNKRMRYVFDRVDWYIPVTTDVRDVLTPLEKENIDLIKRYEDHAERYYDTFGR